jgi:hypothetical protein
VGKETEIIKQMYDVAILSDRVAKEDKVIVKEKFVNCALQNIKFRGLKDIRPDDVLRDLIETSIIIFMNGKLDTTKFKNLQDGISRLRGYIYKEKYNYNKALRDSGKAAHMALSLLLEEVTHERFVAQVELYEDLDPKYLKRMKVLFKLDKEAYFHWGRVLTQFKESD